MSDTAIPVRPHPVTTNRHPAWQWVTATALGLALVAGSATSALAITPAPDTLPQTPTVDITEQVVDLTFPVADPGTDVRFTDDFLHLRGGGSRLHAATDLMAPKHRPVHAAVGGTITWAPSPEPSYGWMVSIAGDDGRRYAYVHLNNDTPQRNADGSWLDDDEGGIEHAYAPRIVTAIAATGKASGLRIERGELIGWVGDSGNAKGVAPHLHFEIHEKSPELGEYRINPYHSLEAALVRGDVPGAEGFGGTYLDVDPASDHAPAIEGLTTEGIAFGCATDRYCPTTAITRGEVAAYLAEAFALPTTATTTRFTDVSDTHPYVGAIAAVDTAAILNGYGDDRFGPDVVLSREQLASVLVRAFEVPAATGPLPFTDVTPGSTHADAIAAAAEAGLTLGCLDGTRFCRTLSVNRAQMASFLWRALANA